ncbi:hypothetical protein OROGR_007489 [Orobanche gracilis]
MITFDGKVVHGSTFFRYLGSIIQKDGELDGDVAHRIKAGWLKWKSATGVLCDPDMPHRLKGKFYRTAIRPALLYGTECWAVKQCHVQKMNVAEMRMLRWMCGHSKKDRLRNEVIREKVRVAPIDAPVRRCQLGRFEIISLSGFFLLSESNGNRSRTGGLSVSLAGSDGRVLGGGVAGMLKAASPVQVVVGSFIADAKKTKSEGPPPPHLLNFGGPAAGNNNSPTSEGGSSESGEDNDDSPPPAGLPYGNAAQPVANMPLYSAPMGWPNSIKMLPN